MSRTGYMNSKLKKTLERTIGVLAVLVTILIALAIFGGAILLVYTFWDSFIEGFCKVSFVCWHGDPNWLGWILIIFLGVLLGIICLFLFITALVSIIEEVDIWRSSLD